MKIPSLILGYILVLTTYGQSSHFLGVGISTTNTSGVSYAYEKNRSMIQIGGLGYKQDHIFRSNIGVSYYHTFDSIGKVSLLFCISAKSIYRRFTTLKTGENQLPVASNGQWNVNNASLGFGARMNTKRLFFQFIIGYGFYHLLKFGDDFGVGSKYFSNSRRHYILPSAEIGIYYRLTKPSR